MKTKSIVLKLFIVTTVLFMVLFSVQFIFQNVLITKFYKDIKINMLKEEIESLTNILERSFMYEEKLHESLNYFSNKNEVALALINRYGNPEYGLEMQYKSSLLQITSEDGKKYNIYIDTFLKDLSINKDILEEGKNIEVSGEIEIYNGPDVYIFPHEIVIDGQKYDSLGLGGFEAISEDYITIDNESGEENGDYDIKLVKIKGSISSLYIPDEKFYSNLYRQQMLDYNISNLIVMNKVEDLFKRKELVYYEAIDETTGIENIIFIKPVDIKNFGQYLLFTTTSLQPVDDAISIIKNYNIYLFLFAFILVIIAAYIYSKVISRPLIHMKNIASKMAKLDFSSECKINSEDEIGDLANSLNTLSNNLNTSLTQLKEANEKLIDDIERERRQEKIRKEFIANISHELKTPLTVIEGIASGVRDGLYDKHDKTHINSLIEEVSHMNELIFEMLQLSKIESDSYKLTWEIFDISNVVLKVHSKLKALAQNKNIEVSLDAEDIFVKGDSKKIEQVITNLYSNAIRYTNNGERVLICIDEDEEKILFTMENTGTHIPESEIEEIWKPFYRIEKSRNRELGGTGLGLQIVKGILEHHKSDFGVKNTEKGVMFHFSLDKHIDV
ncbi:HAMP domain-containing sensor histidine kinase [Wukongibacter baidiensis]|uniref:sensor histidine kinase n=1 Tax=Wukongibacter baidiensis TaxID=1723361 RepID=UPI003D7FF44D